MNFAFASKRKNYLHCPGIHPAMPLRLNFTRRTTNIPMMFNISSKVIKEIEGPDKFDFNKLFGYSFHTWSNHIDSFMCAWRWDIDRELIGITSYYHRDSIIYVGPKHRELRFVLADYDQQIKLTGNAKFSDTEIMRFVRPDENFYIEFVQDYNMGEFGLIVDDTTTIDYEPMQDTLLFNNFRTWKRVIHPWYGGQETPDKFGLIKQKYL